MALLQDESKLLEQKISESQKSQDLLGRVSYDDLLIQSPIASSYLSTPTNCHYSNSPNLNSIIGPSTTLNFEDSSVDWGLYDTRENAIMSKESQDDEDGQRDDDSQSDQEEDPNRIKRNQNQNQISNSHSLYNIRQQQQQQQLQQLQKEKQQQQYHQGYPHHLKTNHYPDIDSDAKDEPGKQDQRYQENLFNSIKHVFKTKSKTPEVDISCPQKNIIRQNTNNNNNYNGSLPSVYVESSSPIPIQSITTPNSLSMHNLKRKHQLFPESSLVSAACEDYSSDDRSNSSKPIKKGHKIESFLLNPKQNKSEAPTHINDLLAPAIQSQPPQQQSLSQLQLQSQPQPQQQQQSLSLLQSQSTNNRTSQSSFDQFTSPKMVTGENDDDSGETSEDEISDDGDKPNYFHNSGQFQSFRSGLLRQSDYDSQIHSQFQRKPSIHPTQLYPTSKSYSQEYVDVMRVAVQQAAVLLGQFYNADPMQILYFAQMQGAQAQSQVQSQTQSTPFQNTLNKHSTNIHSSSSASSSAFPLNSRITTSFPQQSSNPNFESDISSISPCSNTTDHRSVLVDLKSLQIGQQQQQSPSPNENSLYGQRAQSSFSSEFDSSRNTDNSYTWPSFYPQSGMGSEHERGESGSINLYGEESPVSENRRNQNSTASLNDRKFNCPDCGKRYKQKSHLLVHRRTHDGVRPFSCSFESCTKSFITNSALRAHIRVHSGERPYVCGMIGCGRMFSTNSNLRRHERTHNGGSSLINL